MPIKSVKEQLEQIDDKKLREKVLLLFEHICTKRHGFLEKPAAKHHHHAYRGGLEKHTAEVIALALRINELVNQPYKKDEIILAAFLHDLGKLYVYRFALDGIQAMDTPISEEAFVFRFCMMFGIEPNIDILAAIEGAHGGWALIAKNPYIEPTGLSAIIHSADLLSAKILGKEKKEGK